VYVPSKINPSTRELVAPPSPFDIVARHANCGRQNAAQSWRRVTYGRDDAWRKRHREPWFRENVETRSEDDAEDGQSVGVVIGSGKFHFIYLGDMTWNTSKSLFCPNNLVGTVDAYLITHHAQAMPKEMGDYYCGLSCCSAGHTGTKREGYLHQVPQWVHKELSGEEVKAPRAS
jgi:hypothetical protein